MLFAPVCVVFSETKVEHCNKVGFIVPGSSEGFSQYNERLKCAILGLAKLKP